MAMKPKGRSALAPTTSRRPKDGTAARAGNALGNMMRPGGAADREGTDMQTGKAPRPKKNPRR